jgi:hypothetical protein
MNCKARDVVFIAWCLLLAIYMGYVSAARDKSLVLDALSDLQKHIGKKPCKKFLNAHVKKLIKKKRCLNRKCKSDHRPRRKIVTRYSLRLFYGETLHASRIQPQDKRLFTGTE